MKNFSFLFACLILFYCSCSNKKNDPNPEPEESTLSPAEQRFTDSIAKANNLDIKTLKNLSIHSVIAKAPTSKYVYISGNIEKDYWYGIFENGKAVFQKTYAGYPDTVLSGAGKVKTLDKFLLLTVREMDEKCMLLLQKDYVRPKPDYDIFSFKQKLAVVDVAAGNEKIIDNRVATKEAFRLTDYRMWYDNTYLVKCVSADKSVIRLYNSTDLANYNDFPPPANNAAPFFPYPKNCYPISKNKYVFFGDYAISCNDTGTEFPAHWYIKVFENLPPASVTQFLSMVQDNRVMTAKYSLNTNGAAEKIYTIKIDISDGKLISKEITQ